MASDTDQYGLKFYDAIREGCRASAAAAAPIILDALGVAPASIIDVGCGEGWWGHAFSRASVEGATVLGIDAGKYDAAKAAPIERMDVDLGLPIVVHGKFDLAVCLEVAEHLPESRAWGFVADLCNLSPLIVFSAAMPDQGGTGHINCQPPAYWAGMFAAHGYTCSGALRWDLWDLEDVEPWYKSNLLVFSRSILPFAKSGLFNDRVQDGPLHVVHPDLWLTR